MLMDEDRTAMEAGYYCWVTRRQRSHYCNLSLPTCWCLPMTTKEAPSGLALVCWLPSNKKKPPQSWPSCASWRAIKEKPLCAVHQEPEKSLTRAISLAPMAVGFPAHLVPLGLPWSKQSYHLCARFSQGQMQELQGSLRTRPLWVDHTQRWG